VHHESHSYVRGHNSGVIVESDVADIGYSANDDDGSGIFGEDSNRSRFYTCIYSLLREFGTPPSSRHSFTLRSSRAIYFV